MLIERQRIGGEGAGGVVKHAIFLIFIDKKQ